MGGKVKEKLANLVLFDKTTYEKMLTDVPKQKLITPSIISEKLKVNGSLARKAVKELLSKNLISHLELTLGPFESRTSDALFQGRHGECLHDCPSLHGLTKHLPLTRLGGRLHPSLDHHQTREHKLASLLYLLRADLGKVIQEFHALRLFQFGGGSKRLCDSALRHG